VAALTALSTALLIAAAAPDGIAGVPTTDGRSPDRAQELPSLPQIARFLSWATKVKTDPPALSDAAQG